tara:strand:- start:196 stop:426 length:231 start_codon:yes stop_codon:yes gene_type:complete
MAVKKLRKWNPKYTKTSVKVAMQNAFVKVHGLGELTSEQVNVINSVLEECDTIVKDRERRAEERKLARLEAKNQKA